MRARTLAALASEPVPGWQFDAACAEVDPEAWFPELGSFAPAAVFTICEACPVRRSCLASALHGHEQGIWAGTTALDRRALVRLLQIGVPVTRVLDFGLTLAANEQRRGTETEAREAEAA
jgi:hypothetical protein